MNRRKVRRQSKTFANRKLGKVLVVTSNTEEEVAVEIVYQRAAKYQKPSFLITSLNEVDEHTSSSKSKLVYEQKQ